MGVFCSDEYRLLVSIDCGEHNKLLISILIVVVDVTIVKKMIMIRFFNEKKLYLYILFSFLW